MIPAHEQRLRAERDAAVAEAAELRAQILAAQRNLWDVIGSPMSGEDIVQSMVSATAEVSRLRDEMGASAQAIVAQRDALADQIDKAVKALHAAGILTFGTLAQGVEKLARERDEARAALSGKTMFCAKCEETERALVEWCADISVDIASANRHIREDANSWQAQLDARGLWRDPAPARADESGGGVAS